MLTVSRDLRISSTKTYVHSVGLSCCFRQWRATSHCRFLHGYAIQVKVEFDADKLDQNNWVVDFGSLKSFKTLLEESFDHKTLVAIDDPAIETFKELHKNGLIQMNVVPSTGCEAFSLFIFNVLEGWIETQFRENPNNIRVKRVTVSEHEGNSAYTERKDV